MLRRLSPAPEAIKPSPWFPEDARPSRQFSATVRLVYKDERVEASVSSSVADRTEFWLNRRVKRRSR